MEEAPENGKESPHSVHANGLIDYFVFISVFLSVVSFICALKNPISLSVID